MTDTYTTMAAPSSGRSTTDDPARSAFIGREPRITRRNAGPHRMPVRPDHDVIVIGGGVVGAACAARLAETGLAVGIIDAGPGVPSATTISGGLLRAYERAPHDRLLALRSQQLRAARPDRPEHAFRRTGSLVLLGARQLAAALRAIAHLVTAGVDAELLLPAELRRRWPALAPEGVAGAVWEPSGGFADPVAVTGAYAETGRLLGVHRLPDSVVHELSTHRGGVRLNCGSSQHTAGAVVVAAGAGAAHLLPSPAHGGAHTRLIQCARFSGAGIGSGLPAVVDLVTGVWGRPTPDGGFLIGRPAPRPVDRVVGGSALSEVDLGEIRGAATARWPWLAALPAVGGEVGTGLYRPAGHLLGSVPGPLPLVAAAGWGGSGFTTAPAAAERATLATLRLLRSGRSRG
ncbi:glycine/D-amino acid oxidase-like deaminating enzyme [Allocatelliglobosispora scoriae]|uniref:Glycine/D-amino acid oxidase-like deaminating enzyme n=1 Tax=Allocatelliglobosispora scoriae TaxID=643052 RepID=A0A841C3P4_9ACTN|nr:FAD-dependent oxidoreductase [Allocatelliglobosispora scoriae]MBB5873451.1 glycine/D-amino acid oxidase-like deaminating enzyme [Allocatelliglobosispora scoriae]